MTMALGSFASRVVATKVVATDGTGDFTDIASAIADLPTGGGVVYVREGTYTISSQITIDKSNVSIIGAGRSTILNQSGYTGSIFYADTKNDIVIQGLYIDGNGLQAIGEAGVKFVTCTFCIVDTCWIYECKHGVYLSGGSNLTIKYCKIYDPKTAGIFGGGADVRILYNEIHGSDGYGVQLGASTYLKLMGNHIYSNSSDGIYASAPDYGLIAFNSLHNNASENIYIINTNNYLQVIGNYCYYCTTTNLYMSACHNAVVADNVCSGAIQHGIALSSCNHCVVSNNVCNANDSGNQATYDGIILVSSDNCIVANNRCRENDRYEINISNAACDKCLVHGNICIGADHVGAINDSGTGTVSADNIVV